VNFIVLPIAEAALVRKALAEADGLSRRAVVMRDGEPDLALTEQLGAALDTTDCVGVGDDDGSIACFALPANLDKYLGSTVTVDGEPITLPTVGELVDEGELPASLKAVRQAKRDAVALALGFPPEEPPP
jgi:hypothetical protein